MIENYREINIDQNSILLVEDDPNDITLIKRALCKTNCKYPIQIVNNGEEAIAYLSGKGKFIDRKHYPLPALIILDIKLPRKSGHEVLEWYRDQSGIKQIPIVVLTSSNRKADINKAYDLGANSYIIKPVSYHSLFDLMQGIISNCLKFDGKLNNFKEEIYEENPASHN